MGRIKSTMIKKVAKQLSISESKFNEHFEHNKRVLQQTTLPSKSTRNKIAGYIGRVIRMRNNPKSVAKPVVIEEEAQYQQY